MEILCLLLNCRETHEKTYPRFLNIHGSEAEYSKKRMGWEKVKQTLETRSVRG